MTNTPETPDYRPEDIALLQRHGIERAWVTFWEEQGHRFRDVVPAEQGHWHLSRQSFLAGYLLAKAI